MNKSTEQLIREVLTKNPKYMGKPRAIIEEIKNQTTTEGIHHNHKRRSIPTIREYTSIMARLVKPTPVPANLSID
jgi:hypothetical protein